MYTVFTGDLSLVPSICIESLTTAYNSRSTASELFIKTLQEPEPPCAYPHKDTHNYSKFNKLIKIKKELKNLKPRFLILKFTYLISHYLNSFKRLRIE